MKFIFFEKHKSDILFVLGGVVLLGIMAYLFVDSLDFLIIAADNATRDDNAASASQKFNLEGLSQLGIAVPSPAASPTPVATPVQ